MASSFFVLALSRKGKKGIKGKIASSWSEKFLQNINNNPFFLAHHHPSQKLWVFSSRAQEHTNVRRDLQTLKSILPWCTAGNPKMLNTKRESEKRVPFLSHTRDVRVIYP
jgi:hypothetical protein